MKGQPAARLQFRRAHLLDFALQAQVQLKPAHIVVCSAPQQPITLNDVLYEQIAHYQGLPQHV